MCRAKPYELKERTEEEKEKSNEHDKRPEIIEEESEAENDDKIEDSETEREEEYESEMRRDLQNDIIGAKYLQVEKSVYFMDYEIFSVEVPLKDHWKPKIFEAKK